MLLVKTSLAPSKIAGNGLFAQEFIPKGTIVWDFHQGWDRKFTREEVESLPAIMQTTLKKYCYFDIDERVYIFCMDDARFTNHSDSPNTMNGAGNQTIAVRDIQPGEEITCDYYEFDAEADLKLGR